MIEYKVKVYENGDQAWHLNGKLHREDGPAYIRAAGYRAWWLNGKRHREDGPAVIWASGTQEWWLNDKLHREDGPARIYANGTQEWWLNGKEVTEAAVMQPTKELTVAEVEQLLGYRIKIVK
jgi:hypothetical protein